MGVIKSKIRLSNLPWKSYYCFLNLKVSLNLAQWKIVFSIPQICLWFFFATIKWRRMFLSLVVRFHQSCKWINACLRQIKIYYYMEEIILPFGYGSPLLLKCNPAFLPPPPPSPNHHLFSHLSTKNFFLPVLCLTPGTSSC